MRVAAFQRFPIFDDPVRIGETVHRPAGSWTPTVHALLCHIRARGFHLAPEPLGVDARGREVLSYLDGSTVLRLIFRPRNVRC